MEIQEEVSETEESLGTRTAVGSAGVLWPPQRGEPSEAARVIWVLRAQAGQGLLGGGTVRSFSAALGCSQNCLFSVLRGRGAPGPEKLLANGVKCSVPAQFRLLWDLLVISFVLIWRWGWGIRDDSWCRKWDVRVGNGNWPWCRRQLCALPSPPGVPLLLSKGIGQAHSTQGLAPQLLVQCPCPTCPLPLRRLHFLLNQQNVDIYLVQGLRKQH
ncbi:hypothetical protein HJG60_011004 [Phyllostomus discolor]|uniref:Uncharacterized protein n=1 Tax=Phyllostomus discolor TaxID=89673 RepID=A0A834EAL6_9CHIR|nr:hypothetical protein HJG60_011004 [Phyllostomus discolor]